MDRDLDVCVAGGAEILGLHATVAPRRQQMQSPPSLEEYRFVPYYQEGVLAGDANLQEYNEACLSLKHDLGTSTKSHLCEGNICREDGKDGSKALCRCSAQINAQDMEKLAKDDKAKLLQMLLELWNSGRNSSLNQLTKDAESRMADLKQDKLLGGLAESHVLKVLLDVVLENTASPTKLKIIEYMTMSQASPALCEKILAAMATQPLLRVEYIVTGPGVQNLDQTELDSLGVAMVTWDTDSDRALPNQLADVDVVILNGVLSDCSDHNKLLVSLREATHDGGFLLALEPTTNLSIPHFIRKLNEKTPTNTADFEELSSDNPYRDVCYWQTLLNSLCGPIVAQMSDGILNTGFLCRSKPRPTTEQPQPRIIDVSSLDFSWVEDLKAAMGDPALSRVWLTVDSNPVSGIIGMVNCLRLEPGGDKIR